jgi:hypothetical protein
MISHFEDLDLDRRRRDSMQAKPHEREHVPLEAEDSYETGQDRV